MSGSLRDQAQRETPSLDNMNAAPQSDMRLQDKAQGLNLRPVSLMGTIEVHRANQSLLYCNDNGESCCGKCPGDIRVTASKIVLEMAS